MLVVVNGKDVEHTSSIPRSHMTPQAMYMDQIVGEGASIVM